MARQRKYPRWPGPDEKEVPYDTEHFKMWCVETEGMSERSAQVYVSRIRTAFELVFNGDYSLFRLLAQAFRGYCTHPEICLKNLEKASDYLENLIVLMAQLPPKEFFESKGLNYKEKTLSEWCSAFSTYHRYYNYRIDKLRLDLGIISQLPDTRHERIFPLKKEFSEYLKQECRYAPASVWSDVTYLSRLKYFFLDFIADDAFDVISEDDDDWESICTIFNSLFKLIDLELEMISKDLPDHFSVVLSVDDIKRGKSALRKYHDFIRYRIKNKQKFQTLRHAT